jgi:CubicO group peptidase (beta-lactamase class C family)
MDGRLMARTTLTRTVVVPGALMGLGIIALALSRPDLALKTGVGTAAHDLCSETFVSGLDPSQTFAESLAPRPGFRWIAPAIRYEVDRERREVRASLLGLLARRATFRGAGGCVLLDGEGTAPALSVGEHAPALLADIAGPELVEPTTPALKAALDAAFAEPAQAPHRWTKAVVIVHRGRVVAERYAPGYRLDTPLLGFSMTKSVTNALVGLLVHQGRLTVTQPAPIAAWRADAREQLMRMESGLDLDETGSGFDPSNRMFYTEDDMAAFAERAQVLAPPATRWSYSSASTHLVSRIIRDATGGTGEAVQRFAFRALFDVLGMRSVTFESDATGTPIGAHYLLASARDWARFGTLFVNDGVVEGQRLLPEGWVAFSTKPTLGTAYGAGWWTSLGTDSPPDRRAPTDAFFAFGNLGQRIAVIPSEQVVIVRLARAHLPRGDMAGFEQLVVDTLAALHRPDLHFVNDSNIDGVRR